MSGPAVLHQHTPLLEPLNGTNPDLYKSSTGRRGGKKKKSGKHNKTKKADVGKVKLFLGCQLCERYGDVAQLHFQVTRVQFTSRHVANVSVWRRTKKKKKRQFMASSTSVEAPHRILDS